MENYNLIEIIRAMVEKEGHTGTSLHKHEASRNSTARFYNFISSRTDDDNVSFHVVSNTLEILQGTSLSAMYRENMYYKILFKSLAEHVAELNNESVTDAVKFAKTTADIAFRKEIETLDNLIKTQRHGNSEPNQ